MREAKGRGWAGPLPAGAALLLVLALAAAGWAWNEERWWKRAPRAGEVLVALRFPGDFLEEPRWPFYFHRVEESISKGVVPVTRVEMGRSCWSRAIGFRMFVRASRVPDLDELARRCRANLAPGFDADVLLLVRGTSGDVLQVIPAARR